MNALSFRVASPALRAVCTPCRAAAFVQRRSCVSVSAEFQTGTNGLKWKDTVVGSGKAPEAGTRIKAHYTGRLVSNGQVFDSSVERGSPLVFFIGVGQVIKGWDLGILGSEADGIPSMKEGGKRTLIIPPELGYGSRGAGGVIPGGAILEFDVELLA